MDRDILIDSLSLPVRTMLAGEQEISAITVQETEHLELYGKNNSYNYGSVFRSLLSQGLVNKNGEYLPVTLFPYLTKWHLREAITSRVMMSPGLACTLVPGEWAIFGSDPRNVNALCNIDAEHLDDDDRTVSPQHFALKTGGGKAVLLGLSSSNGTRVYSPSGELRIILDRDSGNQQKTLLTPGEYFLFGGAPTTNPEVVRYKGMKLCRDLNEKLFFVMFTHYGEPEKNRVVSVSGNN